MRKIKVTTPENIEIEYKIADLGSRAAATIIDLLIQSVLIILIGIAVLILAINAPLFWESYYGWIIGVSLVIVFLIYSAYYIILEYNMNGRTPGKKLLKLRTIRNNGQPITFKHSAIRNLFRVFIDLLGVGPIFIFFSPEHKRVGDYAASTIVVIEEKSSQAISLENLYTYNDIDSLNYFINQEEYELLREYVQRKNEIEDASILKDRLVIYFNKKYKEEGIPKSLENLLENL